MFGRNKPVVFDPYGGRRSRRRLPRWLLWLLVGASAGAGGVIYVQERHLPARLSAKDSTALRAAFQQADTERQGLKAELDDTRKRLAAALADNQGLTAELAGTRAGSERLRGDLAALASALPPDPRGGTVAVRAARFTVDGQALGYDVVLSRAAAGGTPWRGVVQFVVVGASARGPEASFSSTPVAVSIAQVETLRGSVPLPEGFTPRQATIRVLDGAGGKLMGMRVINVR
jgi:hypothetical protein